jgi:hypothetical protein
MSDIECAEVRRIAKISQIVVSLPKKTSAPTSASGRAFSDASNTDFDAPSLRATFTVSLFSQMAAHSVLYGDRVDTTIVSSKLSDSVDSPDRTEPLSAASPAFSRCNAQFLILIVVSCVVDNLNKGSCAQPRVGEFLASQEALFLVARTRLAHDLLQKSGEDKRAKKSVSHDLLHE